MRSCRNFSKALASKILSEEGWVALIVNFYLLVVCADGWEGGRRIEKYLLSDLALPPLGTGFARLAGGGFLRIKST